MLRKTPKYFRNMSSKTRTKSRAADLSVDETNQLKTTCDKDKGMLFAEKLSSVFVKESEDEAPRIIPKSVPSL